MSSSEQPATPPAGQESRQLIDIKIIGPHEEVRTGIEFKEVPKTSTVGELKERIEATLSSHPPPNKQRLIFLGRVLQPDTETLLHFFGENLVSPALLHFRYIGRDNWLLNMYSTDD